MAWRKKRIEVLEAVNGRVWGTSPTEQTVSLRRTIRWVQVHASRLKGGIPHANKFYLDIHRESLLKRVALFPSNFIIATEHLVREGNLLVVPRGEKAHL